MQITKKTYEKPVLSAERFVPNNYCEICFYIRCEVPYHTPAENNEVWSTLTTEKSDSTYTPPSGSWFSTKDNDGNMYENYNSGIFHKASACGNRQKQSLVAAEGGVGFTMREWSEEQKAWLNCNDLSINGDIVKWTTSNSWGKWYHWGYKNNTDTTKGANHS